MIGEMKSPNNRVDHKEKRKASKLRQLNVVQQWFQAVITHPEGIGPGIETQQAQELIPIERTELERIVRRSHRLSADQRLAVYANAYYARLVECLGECFPVFRKATGEEVFNSFAFEYLQRYPSTSYTLDRLGRHFGRFLDETRPQSETSSDALDADWLDFLIDLATLEWTVAQVFDGPGAEHTRTLGPSDLRNVPVEHFSQATLTTVVCFRLLKFRYPVNTYYTAVRGSKDSTEIPIPDGLPEYAAITRCQYVVRRYILTATQYTLLKRLQAGETVSEAISAAAEDSHLDDNRLSTDLHSWFRTWISEGFFQSIQLPPVA